MASPAQIPADQQRTNGKPARYKVLYDGQCEICQASVSWLRLLDKRCVSEPIPISAEALADAHPDLRLDRCLRELHVVAPGGEIHAGFAAVMALARECRYIAPFAAVLMLPPLRWIGDACYRFIAHNRYALSKCRGGACSVSKPQQVRRRATLRVLWSCYTIGMLLRLPLIAAAGVRDFWRNLVAFLNTRRRRIDLLDGRLSLLFLGGFPTEIVPLLFGERFTGVLYDGVLVDPGSPRMRRSLASHLRRLRDRKVCAVVATHHHEEHTGNLDWAAIQLNAPVYTSAATATLLRPAPKIPWVRSLIIGQLESLSPAARELAATLRTNHGELKVMPAPGHCADQIVLYDAATKVLLAGDAFMGSYFSTPNPDVDSCKWIESLERLLQLEIQVFVEGHGHVHTLRSDIPDIAGVVIREDPMQMLREKVSYLRWIRAQIEAGVTEGLPPGAVEATCFPWGQRWSWERFTSDQFIRMLSIGHFSRTELVRSFYRDPQSRAVLPLEYRLRLYR